MKKPVNNLFHPIDSIISSCIRINFCNLHSPTYSDRTPRNPAIPLDSSGKHPLPRTTSRIAPLPPHKQWLVAVVVGAVAMGSGGLQSLPHEQWLVRLGVGGALFDAGGCMHRHSTHNPPHEQWLVRLGVGGALAAYIVIPTRVPPHEQWLVRLGRVVCCPSYPLGEVG
jgi:hypothetical protein